MDHQMQPKLRAEARGTTILEALPEKRNPMEDRLARESELS
jgi:hypothetical protein